MKVASVTLHLPLDDGASEEDARALGALIERILLSETPPADSMLVTISKIDAASSGGPKLHGRVARVALKDDAAQGDTQGGGV